MMKTTIFSFSRQSGSLAVACARCFMVAVLLSGALSVAGARKNSMPQNLTTSGTNSFNALDYVLQKPLSNERFPNKKFGDHLFVTGEGGITMMHSPRQFIGNPEAGARAGIAVGDWFTPVHGWKIGINAGRHRNSLNGGYYFGGLSFDYLMNLSALAHKDNPYRKFEFIGVAGVEGQLLFRSGSSKWGAIGAHLGLQARYNVTPSTFIYIEPRVGVYSDGVDGVKTWQHYDWEASFLVGIGYRLSGIRPRFTARLDNDRFVNNTFYGVSAGGIGLVHKGMFSADRLGPVGSIFFGKWASSISGWRLSLTAGAFGSPSSIEPGRAKYGMAEIDYLWNINSVFSGFNPSATFHTNIALGAVAAVSSRTGTKLHPGIGVSLQAVWNLNPNLALYLEPRARVFNNDFAGSGEPVDAVTSVSLGLQYKFGKYNDPLFKYNTLEAYAAYAPTKKYFMTLGGGMFRRNGNYRKTVAGFIGVGRWFTPVSAWRVTADYEYYRPRPRSMSLGVTADYMLSLSSMVAGYNPDRVFDLLVSAGVYGGIANYNHANKLIVGFKGSAQARFNVSSSFDVFVEPQLLALRMPGYPGGTLTPDLRLFVGVNYKLGGRDNRDRQDIHSVDDGKRNYVSFSAGPSFFSETMLNSSTRRLTGAIDASVGRWFSSASGGRIGLGYDFITVPWRNGDAAIGTLHADYMLNFTKLFEGDRDQTFNLIGLVGAGVGWSDAKNSGLGIAVEGGVQFRLNGLLENIDFFAEPVVTLWHRKLYPGFIAHQFVGVGRLMIGAAYRF